MSAAPQDTEEQTAIINFIPQMVKDKDFLAGVKAFAGCGKSYVLKQSAKRYPDIKFLGLAFNNSIAKENKASFPKRNTKWFTVHGFAKTYLKKLALDKEGNCVIDFDNVVSDFKPIELFDILNIKDTGNYALGKAISECMKVFCQSDLTLEEFTPAKIREAGINQLNPIILEFNGALLEAAVNYANKLWYMHEKQEVPPTFNFYLKFFEVYQYAKQITEFNLLMIDEAQDSNFVTYSIAKQLPCAIIAVGDEHQSIYGFRGTLNLLALAQKSFYLSATFRYVPKIAQLASNILNRFKGEKVPIKSFAKESVKVDGKIAILSRNNSTMIAIIEQLIKNGKVFTTVKKPEELFSAALALLEFRLTGATTSKEYEYINKNFSNIDELVDYIEESQDNELKTAFSMQRRYGKQLYVFLKVAKEMYQKHRQDSKVVLSTAHTSKGLEWDHVELLSDFPDISNLLQMANIKSSRELIDRMEQGDSIAFSIAQEVNLFYVAVTRARFGVTKRSVTIDEDE